MNLEEKHLVLLGQSDKEQSVALASILEYHGIAVVATGTYGEFLDSLNKHQEKVDLVCINGKLASERGGLLIARVKSVGSKIKVVIVADEDDERSDILRYGADEFLQKPIPTEAIANKIAALLLKP